MSKNAMEDTMKGEELGREALERVLKHEEKTFIQALDDARQVLDNANQALANARQASVQEIAELARAAILPYFSEHRLTYRVSTTPCTARIWHAARNSRGSCRC